MWNGPGGINWQNWPNASQQQMQDLRHDQIDWASLAKQWIQKKDQEVPVTCAAPPVTTVGYSVLSAPPPPPPPPEITAPPAPSITAPVVHHTSPPLPPGLEVEDKEADVQGEMDMEIEEEHHHSNGGEFTETSWQWNNPVPPTVNHPPHSHNTWNYHTNSWGPGGGRPNATTWSVEGGSSFPPSNQEEDYIPQYGTEPDFSMGGRTAAQMILDAEKEADFQLDAAQRRKLPLWIREGLEKMEREKIKQMEREKAASEKEALMKRRRDAGDWKNDDPSRSKFDSDSDPEEPSNDSIAPTTGGKVMTAPAFQRRKSRFDALAEAAKPRLASVPEEGDSEEEKSEKEEAEEMPPVSREEKLKEKTLLLRKWMTEVLLEVTSELLESVCTEVMERAKSKAPAVEVHKQASSGLASLTGGVLGGLSMYSDSDESDAEGKSRGASPQPNESDSDEELQNTITAKKKRFESVEKAIMDRLQKQAMKELGETAANGDSKGPKEQDASERKDLKTDEDNIDGIRDESPQSTELSQASSTTDTVRKSSAKKADEISDDDSTSSVESKKSKKKKSKKEKHKKSKDKKREKKKRRRSDSDGSSSEDDAREKNSSRSTSAARSDISKRPSIDRRSNDRSSKYRYSSRDKTTRYSRDRRTERESSSRYSRHSRTDRSRSRRKDRSRSRRKDRSRSRLRDRSRSSRRDRSRSRSGRSRRHRSRSESKKSKRDRSHSRSKRSRRHRSRSGSKKSSRRVYHRSYSPSVSSRSASRSISPYRSSKYKKSSRRRSRS